MKRLMMTMVAAAGIAAAAWADVSFSYSGQLRTETGGVVATKNQTITFSLYDVATGGTALWSRMVAVQLDDNGYFAVELSNAVGSPVGGETSLEKVFSDNATLYVGLDVNGSSGEISPRQKLLSTPRAAYAEDVKTAKQDFTVNGAATFLSGLQIGAGTGAKAEINANGEITAKKLTVPTLAGSISVGDALSAKSVTASGALSAQSVTASGALSAQSVTVSGALSANSVDATTVKQGGNVLIPTGVIVMWSGTTPPSGWALCDGSNGTPDLRGRFVVGYNPSDADYNAIKKTGGAKTVTLNGNQIPSHAHLLSNDGDWWKVSVDDSDDFWFYVPYAWKGGKSVTGSGGQTVNQTTGHAGGGQAHENRPPYYTLAYIMKL